MALAARDEQPFVLWPLPPRNLTIAGSRLIVSATAFQFRIALTRNKAAALVSGVSLASTGRFFGRWDGTSNLVNSGERDTSH